VLAANFANVVEVQRCGLPYSEHRILGQGDHLGDHKLLAEVRSKGLGEQVQQLRGGHSHILFVVLVGQTLRREQLHEIVKN
jgi:hypothetical protein